MKHWILCAALMIAATGFSQDVSVQQNNTDAPVTKRMKARKSSSKKAKVLWSKKRGATPESMKAEKMSPERKKPAKTTKVKMKKGTIRHEEVALPQSDIR